MQTGEGYKWRVKDFIQAPFALVVGSLNALGTESSASYCSRYTLSSRQYINDAEPFFEAENKLDGYDYYHKAFKFVDNIAFACYATFSDEIGIDHITNLIANPTLIITNFLYNFGMQWVDIQNYLFYNYKTVPQQDWGFFFFYTVGDFFMRFLFNASDGSATTTTAVESSTL